jgi:hypothetical protein
LAKRFGAAVPAYPWFLTSGYSHVLAEGGRHGGEWNHEAYAPLALIALQHFSGIVRVIVHAEHGCTDDLPSFKSTSPDSSAQLSR